MKYIFTEYNVNARFSLHFSVLSTFATAQEKQGIGMLIFPDRENAENQPKEHLNTGKLPPDTSFN